MQAAPHAIRMTFEDQADRYRNKAGPLLMQSECVVHN